MTEAFMPLLRDRFDPVAELGARRAEQPVSKLEFPFGISAWLVTRYDDVKQVLGSAQAYSTTSPTCAPRPASTPARPSTRAVSDSPTRPITPDCGDCSPRNSPCAAFPA